MNDISAAICHCDCHIYPGAIIHLIICCEGQCKYCHKFISFGYKNNHQCKFINELLEKLSTKIIKFKKLVEVKNHEKINQNIS